MRLVISLFEPFGRDMRIDLRRDEVRVAQQFLDAPQIGPGIEQVRRVTVTEFVRSELRIEPGNCQITFQPQLHQTRIQRRSFFGVRQENRRRPGL